MTYNASENWQIDHQCPQCGAPVTLDEADRLLLCPFCRTKLYLVVSDHFRYCIPAPEATSRDIIYLPYWRLKGLSFAVSNQEVTSRCFDTNLLALDVRGITLPLSLGLRPQVLKLRFASPEMAGRFLEPGFNAQMAMERLSAANPSTLLNAFIGEMISLIYSPTYLENDILYDALLQRPLSPSPLPLKTEDWNGLLTSGYPQDRQLRFIPTLCPQCGWDLQGDREALILICRNCDSAWSFQATGLERVTFSIITADRENVHCYLPFWRMKASIEGISLSSYADLIRVGNLPKAITRELEEKLLYFWSPAFKINPALFLRWTRQMTIYQPEGKSVDTFPEATIHPVTLPASEAQESIIITLASLITDKRKFFPLLPKIRIAIDEFMLEYHPFLINRNELVHAQMNLTIDKNSLAFGVQL